MSLNAAPQRGPLRAPEVSVLVIGVCSFSGLSRRSFSEGGRVELGAWSFPLPPERGALLRKLSSGTTTPVSPVSPSCVSLINFLFLIGNLRKSPEFVVFHWIQRHVAKKNSMVGFRRISADNPVFAPNRPRTTRPAIAGWSLSSRVAPWPLRSGWPSGSDPAWRPLRGMASPSTAGRPGCRHPPSAAFLSRRALAEADGLKTCCLHAHDYTPLPPPRTLLSNATLSVAQRRRTPAAPGFWLLTPGFGFSPSPPSRPSRDTASPGSPTKIRLILFGKRTETG
jgi:hypothetical protein